MFWSGSNHGSPVLQTATAFSVERKTSSTVALKKASYSKFQGCHYAAHFFAFALALPFCLGFGTALVGLEGFDPSPGFLLLGFLSSSFHSEQEQSSARS